MKEKGKIVLIVLALIAFLTIGILLITKIGNVSDAQGAVNKQYYITYDGNGGNYNDLKKYNEKAIYGSNYKVLDNIYTREGYVFAGWNEKKDGTGTSWTSLIEKEAKWLYKNDVTLYAQWVKGTTLIKDPEFERCLVHSINKEFGSTKGNTAVVTAAGLAQLQNLNCSYVDMGNNNVLRYSVSDITGIEKMESLVSLSLSNSSIKKLDLSKNTKLQVLSLRNLTNITSLKLTKNTALTDLSIVSANLTSLNITKNTKIKNLTIDSLFGLSKLDLSKNKAVQTLKLSGLPKVTSLNLKAMTKLKDMALYSVGVTSLDLSKNTKLEKIGLQGLENITKLNLKNNKKLNIVSLDTLTNLKTLTLQSSILQNNVLLMNCPNTKVSYVTYANIDINTKSEGNGYLGDNMSGTLLACRSDYVQFKITSKVGSTIKKVEYSTNGQKFSALNSKNITYSDGAAIIKIKSSQKHIMFKITDANGNVQVTKTYGICIGQSTTPTADFVNVDIDTQASGNGFLGDNISGTLLVCKNDYVQFTLSSKINTLITKVEYSKDGQKFSALNSKNITYSDGGAIVKLTGSQSHIIFKVTDNQGNVQITTAYGVCVNK